MGPCSLQVDQGRERWDTFGDEFPRKNDLNLDAQGESTLGVISNLQSLFPFTNTARFCPMEDALLVDVEEEDEREREVKRGRLRWSGRLKEMRPVERVFTPPPKVTPTGCPVQGRLNRWRGAVQPPSAGQPQLKWIKEIFEILKRFSKILKGVLKTWDVTTNLPPYDQTINIT